MNEKTFPVVLRDVMKDMIENPTFRDLLKKIDYWFKCSCEPIYQSILIYYLERGYGEGKVKAEVEGGKKKRIDVGLYNSKNQLTDVVEIRTGKLRDVCKIKTTKNDFDKLYKGSIRKLIDTKRRRNNNIRCYLLKITHGLKGDTNRKIKCGEMKNLRELPYEEKVKFVGEMLEEELNKKISEELGGDYKIRLVDQSSASEGERNEIFMYHLFEVIERQAV